MKIEILCTGDEVLTGKITNTNFSHMAQKLQVKLWNNGVLKQNFNTDDMAHKIARCIEWVSSVHTLLPGDILATGTNHRGLNAFQHGDRIDLEVEHVGKLSITVRDALGRTWGRDTRLERAGMTPDTTPQLTGKYAKAWQIREGLIA